MYRFVKMPSLIVLCCAFLFTPAVKIQAQAISNASNTPDAQKGVREMQEVEDRWSDAVTKRDQYGLELVLAPQFIGISSTGDVTTRDQQIARLFVRDAEPVSLEQKVISARFAGNVAIVNGTYVKHWKLAKGPLDEEGVYSHVYEHSARGWVCLNAQQTVVAEKGKAAAPEERPKAKSSDAALPFHIPLIYKGPSSNKPAPAPGSNEPPS